MQLQFGLFDYIIIAIFYGVAGTLLLLAWLLLRKWRYWPAVVVPLATIVVVLPWADEVWIAWRFGELCKNAGVRVYKKVDADGYLNSTHMSAVSDIRERIDTDKRIVEEFDKRGFRFVEYSLMDGKVLRSERIDAGVRRAVHDKPLARYHYKLADPRQEVPVGHKIEKTEWVVVDSETNEVLGREIRFSRYPAWIQSLWIRHFGNGGTTCEGTAPQPPTLRHLLYYYVVLPRRIDGK